MIFLHNISGSTKSYGFGEILDGEFYQIPSTAIREKLSSNNGLLADFSAGLVKLSIDGVNDFDGTQAEAWAYLLRGPDLPKASDTGGLKITNKFAPDGWLQRLHEIEFTTSTIGGAIHDKNYLNEDTGWSSVCFYELIDGVETLMVDPTQSDLDTKCIRTDFMWMPTIDYMVLSGVVSQIEIPTENVYFWGMFLDVDPALNAYGLFPVEVLGGGMNMKYIGSRDRVGLKGVSGSTVYYGGVDAPSGFVELPEAMGTNRIRYIFRHPAGFKHQIQSIFEIFKA